MLIVYYAYPIVLMAIEVLFDSRTWLEATSLKHNNYYSYCCPTVRVIMKVIIRNHQRCERDACHESIPMWLKVFIPPRISMHMLISIWIKVNSLQDHSYRGSISISNSRYHTIIIWQLISFENLNMNSYEGLIGRPFSPGLSRTSIYALCIIPVPNDTTIWLMVYLLKGFFGHIYWRKGTLVSHLV